MKIDRIELLHLKLRLVRPFETSFGRVEDKDTVIVRAESGGVAGYGEAPAAAAPNYSYETVQTVWHVLRDFLAPKLRDADVRTPLERLFASVRGHPMAKAGLEMAVLDLEAQRAGRTLSEWLGGTRDEIPTGISLGIEDRVESLLERVEEAAARGYRRVKVKIKPGWDVDVVEAIRRRWPALPLMVDANGAYRLADAGPVERLDAFHLMMIEQPLDYQDLLDHAELQKRLRTPLCLDESIRSPDDGRRALAVGACRIVNIKQARVGGPFQAKALHDVCAARNAPVWCGGLLESGIGRAHNIALASLPNFSMPGDISASERYFAEDVIDPPVTVSPAGFIQVPTRPGLGYTVLESRLDKYCVRREFIL